MSTKCDVIRAGAAAVIGGRCSSGSAAPAGCYVTDLASKRGAFFRTKFAPAGLVSGTARTVRDKTLSLLQGDIDVDVARLRTRFGPDAPTDITWNDFTGCLWNPSGRRGGPHGDRYFGRADLASLGYQPRPLFGGKTLEHQLPAALTDAVPVWLDGVLNPGLAVVVIFVLLVLIFAALMLKARAWARGAPRRAAAAATAWRTKMEAHDPYRGTKFESYPSDPNAKWKALIPIYEAQGICMERYREKLGMPVADHCEAG